MGAYVLSQLKRDSRRHSTTRVSSKNVVLEETSCQMLEVLIIIFAIGTGEELL